MFRSRTLTILLFSAIPLTAFSQNSLPVNDRLAPNDDSQYEEPRLEEQLRIVLMKLYGDLTNREIPELGANDVNLIYRSQQETPYAKGALSKLQDTCNYLADIGVENSDALYIARMQKEAHEDEIRDRDAFYLDIYDNLSTEAKILVQDQLLSLSDYSSGSSYEIDFEGFARANPGEYKDSYLESCNIVSQLIKANNTVNTALNPGIMVIDPNEENN